MREKLFRQQIIRFQDRVDIVLVDANGDPH